MDSKYVSVIFEIKLNAFVSKKCCNDKNSNMNTYGLLYL